MKFTRYPRVNDGDNGIEFNYAVNHGFSADNKDQIAAIQDQLRSLGLTDDYFWHSPRESLHTTLFDWTEAVADEVKNDHTYADIQEEYRKAMHEVAHETPSFDVTFDTIKVSKDTVILQSSAEVPEMTALREHFMAKVTWVDGNKQPPNITHITIARCKKNVDIPDIETAVKELDVLVVQRFDTFRLCRATKNSLGAFDIEEQYDLPGTRIS